MRMIPTIFIRLLPMERPSLLALNIREVKLVPGHPKG